MGMSIQVTAYIKDDDPTYIKHAKVLKACLDADIQILPIETAEYFRSPYPEEYLFDEKLEIKIPMTEYSDDDIEGYEILVKDIPVGTHKIRFANSW